jgi:pimeloyl-ACP methyl ester carboxylesterase
VSPVGTAVPPVRRVTVDGVSIGYRELGAGPAVVLLHGWPTCSYVWRYALPALAAAGRRAIAPDLLGLGESIPPAGSNASRHVVAGVAAYTLDDQARMLEGFLTAVDVRDTAVVGLDLGGPIGLLWAVRHPDRLERLVLFDTLVYPRRLLLLRALLAALRIPALGRLAVHPTGIRLLLRLGSARPLGIGAGARREYTRHCTDRRARAAVLRALLGPRFAEFAEITAGLPRLASTEVLIAWADHDLLLPRAEMRRLHAALPQARTTIIERAGHFVAEDQPDQVVGVLTVELAGEPAPARPRRPTKAGTGRRPELPSE